MKAFLRLITLASALALWLVFPAFAVEPEGLGPDNPVCWEFCRLVLT